MNNTVQSSEMVDALSVPDTFVSGLGEIEDIGGGCLRFIFYCKQHVGGREQLVVVSKLIAPMDAVPPAVLMAARAVGLSFVKDRLGARVN